LNAAIEAMNLAKELSSITPAKAVFGTVSVILAMIRVSLLLACADQPQAEMHPGLDDQPGGLRRTGAGLRRCLYCPRPGVEGEEIERPQQLCVRGNQAADDVGRTGNTHFEHLIDDGFGPIPGLSRVSKGRSSSRVNGTQSLDFSTQRTTKRQSPPGGRISTGFFSCLTCVPSLMCGCY